MKVRLFELRAEGYEEAGVLSLQEGQVVGQPSTNPAVQFVLSEPIRVLINGEMRTIRAAEEPALFLEHLPRAYHGSYLRAEAEG